MTRLQHIAARYLSRHVIGIVGGVYGAGLLLVAAIPDVVDVLGNVPGRSVSPLHWYSLLTYSVLHASVTHWLKVLVFTAASLAVLVPRLRIEALMALWAGSAIGGGVTFAVLASYSGPAIGGGMASCGFAGGVVGVWLRQRGTFRRLEQVYAVVLLFGMVGTALFGVTPQDRGMLLAALASAAFSYSLPARYWRVAMTTPEATPAASGDV